MRKNLQHWFSNFWVFFLTKLFNETNVTVNRYFKKVHLSYNDPKHFGLKLEKYKMFLHIFISGKKKKKKKK